jgi:hypothetical protein
MIASQRDQRAEVRHQRQVFMDGVRDLALGGGPGPPIVIPRGDEKGDEEVVISEHEGALGDPDDQQNRVMEWMVDDTFQEGQAAGPGPDPCPPMTEEQIAPHLFLDVANHGGRLYETLPAGSHETFAKACGPAFKALLDALMKHKASQSVADVKDVAKTVENIMRLPDKLLRAASGSRGLGAGSVQDQLMSNYRRFINPQATDLRGDFRGQQEDEEDNVSAEAQRAKQDERAVLKAQSILHDRRPCGLSRAAAALTQGRLADLSVLKVRDDMFKLFSGKPAQFTPAMPKDAAYTTMMLPTVDETRKLLLQDCKGKAPGPSGWTTELLSILAETSNECAEAIGALGAWINSALSQQLPSSHRDLLIAGKVFGVEKEEGKGVYRPILAPEAIMKFAGGLAIARADLAGYDALFPAGFQLGLTKGGVERAIHALQLHLDADKDNVALLLDADNAYNRVVRNKMVEMVYSPDYRRFLGPIMAIVDFTYGGGPDGGSGIPLVARHAGELRGFMRSHEGVLQGLRLASLLYIVATNPTIDMALWQAQRLGPIGHKRLIAVAIHDDVAFVGEPGACFTAFDKLQEINERDKPGYYINLKKSSLLWPHQSAVPASVTQDCSDRRLGITLESVKYLGSRVGRQTQQNQQDHMQLTVEKTKRLLDLLTHPRMSKGNAIILLKACVLPKMSFLARTMPFQFVKATLAGWDELLINKFYEIMDLGTMSDSDRAASLLQVVAPARHGGFGMVSAVRTAPGANLGSLAFAHVELSDYKTKMTAAGFAKLPTVANMTACYDILISEAGLGPLQTVLPKTADALPLAFTNKDTRHKLQYKVNHELLGRVHNKRLAKMAALPKQQAIIEVARHHAAVALRATSFTYMAQSPEDKPPSSDDFVLQTKTLLGHRHYSDISRCKHCNVELREDNSHPLACVRSGSGRTRRHTLLLETLAQQLALTGAVVKKEPMLFSDSEHRLDLLVTTAKLELAVDLTVTEALAQSHVKETAKKTLSASETAIKNKNTLYRKKLKLLNITLFVAPVESTGGYHGDFEKLLSKASHFNDAWTEAQRLEWMYTTYKRCTFALIRGNGRIIREWAQGQRRDSRVVG